MSTTVEQAAAAPECGALLAAARCRAELSLNELARRVGVSRWTITRLERGQMMPGVETAVALARELREPALESFGRRKSRKGQKPSNAGKRYPAEILSAEHLEGLLDACDQHSRSEITRLRNRALIVVLWRAGLRISEALNLTLADIDMDGRTLRVEKSKTKAGIRTVGLDAMAHEALESWFECRPGGNEWVFVSLTKYATSGGTGQQLAYTTANDMLKRLAKQAGIKQRVHPHGLRHQFAFEAHREGMALGVLSEALGHKSPMMTMHYAAHVLDRMEVAQAMQRRTGPAAPVETPPEGVASFDGMEALVDRLMDGVERRLGQIEARLSARNGGEWR